MTIGHLECSENRSRSDCADPRSTLARMSRVAPRRPIVLSSLEGALILYRAREAPPLERVAKRIGTIRATRIRGIRLIS